MAVLKCVKHVNASPALVFAVATDLEHLADYISGVERLEILTDSPIGIGTRYRETREMFGRESTEEMTITGFEPPQRFTVEAKSCGSVFTCEHRFVPDIAGTLVELTIKTEAVTLLARLMSPLGKLMMKPMRKLVEADLEDLKAIAEQRAAADWTINPDAAIRGYESSRV